MMPTATAADDVHTLAALTERQQRVLSVVVQQYVETAQPVGSATIVAQHELGVSPATIRNELAALERLGLLTHPHTSAGRVPTDLGFRFYVRNLLPGAELAPGNQEVIRGEFRVVRQEMDQWLRTSTAVLARTAQGAALATAPRLAHARFKHMELVHIHGAKVLLILVLQEGMVKQQLLDLDEEMAQSELTQVSNELNAHLVGSNSGGVLQTAVSLSPFGRQVAALVADTMSRIDGQESGQVYRDGLAEVLQAPEFVEGASVRRIVQVLEQPSFLEEIVDGYADRNAVHVLISGDGRYEQLRDVSIVLARYGVGDRISGLLGVVGPVRMSYGRTIGAVRLVSDLMSGLVEDLYGP
jgi:heat-inducible transcriptional repressor